MSFFKALSIWRSTIPYELYPIVFNVESLKNGIYHYCPVDHSVEYLKEGSFGKVIIEIFMQQYYIRNSARVYFALRVYWIGPRGNMVIVATGICFWKLGTDTEYVFGCYRRRPWQFTPWWILR